MGADFIHTILPACELTKARREELSKLIAAAPEDEDYLDRHEGVAPPDIDDYLYLERSREVGMHTFDGVRYYITGGLSWGDSPTDAFDVMTHFDDVPGVYDALLKWAKEDSVERRTK